MKAQFIAEVNEKFEYSIVINQPRAGASGLGRNIKISPLAYARGWLMTIKPAVLLLTLSNCVPNHWKYRKANKKDGHCY